MNKLHNDMQEKDSTPSTNNLEDTISSTLILDDLQKSLKAIYDRFKGLRDHILKDAQIAPYIEHQYVYMTKAFSLFIDYYNQYCYCLPLAVKKMQEDLNDYPDDETTQE